MEIRSADPSEVGAIHHLLSANGWAHRAGDVEQLARLMGASQHAIVAVQGAEIVGFARAISDGISNGYLSMVVVAGPFRQQGIGRALVEHILGSEAHITWVLRAGRAGAPGFFARLGFQPSTVAMERPRAR
jgi:ribosomal protein S18 acetylase RimI-like enzyme